LDHELQQVMDQSMKKTLEDLQKTYPKAKGGISGSHECPYRRGIGHDQSAAMNPDDWEREYQYR
jgi:hypothetical protein